jgi:alanine racemase
LKINYTYKEITRICEGKELQTNSTQIIENIVYDSRKISYGGNSIFVSLSTKTNDGHQYIADAYAQGVRTFLVDKTVELNSIPDATVLQVSDVLSALQTWAKFHRSKFKVQLIGITGSAGKTIVKEWLYHVLSDDFVVNRSPKSYNSQLGVALSLFEIDEETDIALIEVGISEKGEMYALEDLVQPKIGVFTSFTSAHRENFSSELEHLTEKLSLFKNCEKIIASYTTKDLDFGNLAVVFADPKDSIEENNKAIVVRVALELGLPKAKIEDKITSLPRVAMRMESFEGVHNNSLLLDAYNLSSDGLEQALAHQFAVSGKKERYLILSQLAFEKIEAKKFKALADRFSLQKCPINLEQLIVFGTKKVDDLAEIKKSSLLFKGLHPNLKSLVSQLKARKHSTFVEISLSALKHNLKFWKKRVPKSVQIMAMVKASSYGSELTKVGDFLGNQNIDYLGVAYVDEGVELRTSGVNLPIMVLNSERSTFEDCIHYKIEPSVYSFEMLEDLVTELILRDIQDFPIHLKFDTGMHRLGFFEEDLPKVIAFLKTQPEVKVKSVYSHLADADNLEDQSFTLEQLKKFQRISENLQNHLPYPILRHVLNTEGLSHYPEYGFDMVRLGIGLYGMTSNLNVKKNLEAVLSWKSQISQIKTLKQGDTISYGRSFMAESETKIAIIPVGYADGFKRALSNGKGGVYIQNVFCPTLGRVCMDMIIVDITNQNFRVGDEVEIIGPNQTVEHMANLCQTISYEIMTSLSPRMPRIFVEEMD